MCQSGVEQRGVRPARTEILNKATTGSIRLPVVRVWNSACERGLFRCRSFLSRGFLGGSGFRGGFRRGRLGDDFGGSPFRCLGGSGFFRRRGFRRGTRRSRGFGGRRGGCRYRLRACRTNGGARGRGRLRCLCRFDFRAQPFLRALAGATNFCSSNTHE
jgi:hypothetical protein